MVLVSMLPSISVVALVVVSLSLSVCIATPVWPVARVGDCYTGQCTGEIADDLPVLREILVHSHVAVGRE